MFAGPRSDLDWAGAARRDRLREGFPVIRFVHHFNYANGVSREVGDAWYRNQHVPQVRDLPGVTGYLSWPQIDVDIPYPSPGAPTPHDQFVRRSEVRFDDLERAVAAVMGNPQLWEPSDEGVPGFREFECMFLREDPQYDLLRDAPPEQYKYMTLPLRWPNGEPEVDLSAEIFMNSYAINYPEDIPLAIGEDWYVGHHNREGKQLPGMKHYKTWLTIPVPENGGALKPNKWLRLTELGMSPEAYKATMVNEESRIRFTPSPYGRVIGDWLNISIKLDVVDDLLTP